eukprot:COSAG05_NODE_1256_length_5360_cov_7.466831_5_plen_198_part_00
MASAKGMAAKDALRMLEAKTHQHKEDMEEIQLLGFMPPIHKLDASLSTLKKCRKLTLSANQIGQLTGFQGMDTLQVLSIGRNFIERIEGLEGVADTLEELLISYNCIERLHGIEKLKRLRVLYISHNNINDWKELARLKELPRLENLLMVNNPLYNATLDGDNDAPWRTEVLRILPNLRVLDGIDVTDDELEAALKD